MPLNVSPFASCLILPFIGPNLVLDVDEEPTPKTTSTSMMDSSPQTSVRTQYRRAHKILACPVPRETTLGPESLGSVGAKAHDVGGQQPCKHATVHGLTPRNLHDIQ